MHEPNDPGRKARRSRLPLAGKAPRTRAVVIATGIAVLGITPFGVAATGDPLREGARNGTTTSETEVISNINSTTGQKGGYSTRQSNLSDSGGGAIYGCRSKVGGSAANPPQNPCVRANNLSTGYAFEFNATNGPIGGLITAGSGGDTKKPFVTNATGVATGLNADRVDGADAEQIVATARAKSGLDADTVDGKDSAELQAKFAQVAGDGTAGETRGVTSGGVARTGTGVYTVGFTGDLTKCGFGSTLVGTDPGEITVAQAVAGGNTTVTVRTFDSTGTAADRAFNIVGHC